MGNDAGYAAFNQAIIQSDKSGFRQWLHGVSLAKPRAGLSAASPRQRPGHCRLRAFRSYPSRGLGRPPRPPQYSLCGSSNSPPFFKEGRPQGGVVGFCMHVCPFGKCLTTPNPRPRGTYFIFFRCAQKIKFKDRPKNEVALPPFF